MEGVDQKRHFIDQKILKLKKKKLVFDQNQPHGDLNNIMSKDDQESEKGLVFLNGKTIKGIRAAFKRSFTARCSRYLRNY